MDYSGLLVVISGIIIVTNVIIAVIIEVLVVMNWMLANHGTVVGTQECDGAFPTSILHSLETYRTERPESV